VGLQSLELRDFRLFDLLTLEPDPTAVTVFQSPNGTGKTSILEAVHALATASSFRTTSAADMIRNHQPAAEVHGVVIQDGRRVQVDLTLTRGARHVIKRMKVNGQHPKTRADLSASLPVTVFTPEGVDMVRHGPEARRAYLNTLLVDVDLHAGEVVERFERVLRQRNALLRSLQGESLSLSARDELDVWTKDFVSASQELLVARRTLVGQLVNRFAACYQLLAGHEVEARLRYETSWHGELSEAIVASREADRFRGFTTIGPHRDDIVLQLDGRDARRQASQGEQRSLALALRLSGHELVRSERRVTPLLLLDDVFGELDPGRAERLLGLLPTGQTLVTTATPLPTSMHPAAIIDLAHR
jgi:DNA replication and repair protein RecF